MEQILPRHIAIVMDGNGRWAQKQGLIRVDGHRRGIEAVKTVVENCLRLKIPVLSLFAFSSENWSRPEMEVNFLMKLFMRSLKNEIESLHEHGVSLRFSGDRTVLLENLQKEMLAAETLTADNNNLILNVAINYSGKWDILQGVKNLLSEMEKNSLSINNLNEEIFDNILSTAGLPKPDLFIRTSGEKRISNFFLWQLAYTELYFTDVHWPDFTKEEFLKALDEFKKRERRYGKISEQIAI